MDNPAQTRGGNADGARKPPKSKDEDTRKSSPR